MALRRSRENAVIKGSVRLCNWADVSSHPSKTKPAEGERKQQQQQHEYVAWKEARRFTELRQGFTETQLISEVFWRELCWMFRVRMNINFKRFILQCVTWSQVTKNRGKPNHTLCSSLWKTVRLRSLKMYVRKSSGTLKCSILMHWFCTKK